MGACIRTFPMRKYSFTECTLPLLVLHAGGGSELEVVRMTGVVKP